MIRHISSAAPGLRASPTAGGSTACGHRGRVVYLDGLRGLAAMQVVGEHY
jgi:hypothetical protein